MEKEIFKQNEVKDAIIMGINFLNEEDFKNISDFFADFFGLQAGYDVDEEQYILTFNSICLTFRKKRNFERAVNFLFTKLTKKIYK